MRILLFIILMPSLFISCSNNDRTDDIITTFEIDRRIAAGSLILNAEHKAILAYENNGEHGIVIVDLEAREITDEVKIDDMTLYLYGVNRSNTVFAFWTEKNHEELILFNDLNGWKSGDSEKTILLKAENLRPELQYPRFLLMNVIEKDNDFLMAYTISFEGYLAKIDENLNVNENDLFGKGRQYYLSSKDNELIASYLSIAARDENEPDPQPEGDSIFFQKSGDGGATWEPEVLVHRSGDKGGQVPQILYIDDELHIVWLRDTRNGALFNEVMHSYSLDGGLTWAESNVIGSYPPQNEIFGMSTTSDGSQMLHVLYRQGEQLTATEHNIKYLYWDKHSRSWSGTKQLMRTGRSRTIDAKVDSQNKLHLMWGGGALTDSSSRHHYKTIQY
jgi:hypothetical protein